MLNRAINIGFRKALPQFTFSSRSNMIGNVYHRWTI